MSKKLKIILGVILIIIGLGYALDLLDIHIFSFEGFFESIDLFWPLLLAVIGVFLVCDNKMIRNIIIILYCFMILGGMVAYTVDNHYNLFDDNDVDNFYFDEDYHHSDNFFND